MISKTRTRQAHVKACTKRAGREADFRVARERIDAGDLDAAVALRIRRDAHHDERAFLVRAAQHAPGDGNAFAGERVARAVHVSCLCR